MRAPVRKGLARAAAILLPAAALFVALLPRGADAPPRSAALVGDTTCVSCHQEQAAFEGTAHRLTSRPASAASIAGSFAPDSSLRRTVNPYLHYRMEARAHGFFQTAVAGAPPQTVTRSERFDLVIGSNRKGQSYLSWRADGQLFQLPVSYWTELGTWVNSPGYEDGVMNFDRPAAPRCLECHSTYFGIESQGDGVTRYDTASAVLGITCESCHGRGSAHVANERSPLRALLRQAIVNPARLPREGRIDGCALCHAGAGEPIQQPFSYRPGEPLADYLRVDAPPPDQEIDVHGNSVALLERSACFRASDMTCSTCHDVHRTQRDAASFSPRCLTCHVPASCGLFPERGPALAENCVDCHMPNLQSKMVVSSVDGRTARPRIRSHWIRVYPDTAGQ